MADQVMELPPVMTKEILKEYADILRVGKLSVNDTYITWQIGGSMDLQLKRFYTALAQHMLKMPECKMMRRSTVQQFTYYICKALSINYIVMEVLHDIAGKLGVMCTIEGSQDATLAEYHVEVLPGPTIRAGIRWKVEGNIVHRDMRTAERVVKATLRSMETEFSYPPRKGHAPTYLLEMERRRGGNFLFGSVPCMLSCVGDQRSVPASTFNVTPSTPLRSSNEDIELDDGACTTTCDLFSYFWPSFQTWWGGRC